MGEESRGREWSWSQDPQSIGRVLSFSPEYIFRKSTIVYVPSSELGLSQPFTHRRVCPTPDSGGRGTLAGDRGVVGVPIPTRGHTLCYSLYLRTLWHDRKKAWSSINQSILSAYTIYIPPTPPYRKSRFPDLLLWSVWVGLYWAVQPQDWPEPNFRLPPPPLTVSFSSVHHIKEVWIPLSKRVDRVLGFFSSRPNWDALPTPFPEVECAPSLWFQGDTLAYGRGGGVGSSSDEGTVTLVL